MPIIHIYGASGSGTSTLAVAISEKYKYKMLDSDDYFWLPTDPAFLTKRPRDERVALMKRDMSSENNVVISGSLCGWGDELIPFFDLVIRLNTATTVRIERLKQREYIRFGNRIEPNGDMFDTHMEFLNWASKYDLGDLSMRSKIFHDEWQKKILSKHITLDGNNTIDLLLKQIEDVFPIGTQS